MEEGEGEGEGDVRVSEERGETGLGRCKGLFFRCIGCISIMD